MATDPAVIAAVLTAPGIKCRRVGFEAGPLSLWLFSGLAEAGVLVICIEIAGPMLAVRAALRERSGELPVHLASN